MDPPVNLTLNVTDISNQIFSNLDPSIRELLALIFSLAGLYIIYLIIRAIFAYFSNKRIKRIDKNVEEILGILKGRDKKRKK